MPRSPAPSAAASADPAVDPVGDFETAMQELEAIVQSLERGELKLEDALARFERGIALARQCRGALQNAELKVQQLLAVGEPDTAS